MKHNKIPEELVHALRYDDVTGNLIWFVSLSNRAPVGSIAGCTIKERYIVVGFRNKVYQASRIIWTMLKGPIPENMEIDHFDKNPSNNKIDNLRLASSNQNKMNRRKQKNNKSGYKGVFWEKACNKWRVQVRANGKRKHIGVFFNLGDAHQAYVAASNQMHAEFACSL